MLRGPEVYNLKRAIACYLYEMQSDCSKCVFGYKRKDYTGDNTVWCCNDDKLLKDALYLLDE